MQAGANLDRFGALSDMSGWHDEMGGEWKEDSRV